MDDPHHKQAIAKLAVVLRLAEHACMNRGYTEVLAQMDSFRDDVENLGAGRHSSFDGTDWNTTLTRWLEVFHEDYR